MLSHGFCIGLSGGIGLYLSCPVLKQNGELLSWPLVPSGWTGFGASRPECAASGCGYHLMPCTPMLLG
eukprot:4420120-Karenia_brevis.AAC.1